MPDAPKGGIKSTTKAIVRSIGTALQMPVALCTETGFQASKVRSRSRHLNEQGLSRVPFDFVISFTPGEVLILTTPAANRRSPGKSVRKHPKLPDGATSSALFEGTIPDLGIQRPF
eukprot:2577549-Amphidinium_carterae.1